MSTLRNAANSLLRLADEYHMSHRPPSKSSGAPAYDITLNDIYPKDVYQHPEWYMTREPADTESWNQVVRSRGKPKARVMIYRAVPKAVYVDHAAKDKAWAKGPDDVPRPQAIHKGDWVSLSKTYATQHSYDLDGPGKDGVVVKKQVFADQVYTNGDSINEWGYDP